MARKEGHSGSAWYGGDPALVRREPGALAQAREDLGPSIRFFQFVQYAFARQWRAGRLACQKRKVTILGDLPIFVAQDSADVWARPHLFWLAEHRRAAIVAGVPPPCF